MTEWQPDATYDLGDEIVHTPRKVVTLTGFAWLWAKLTGEPTEWVEEGKPQVYRVGRAVDVPTDCKWTELT